MTSCWDTSNTATKESDITKCLSDHKISVVNAKFWCQSLKIKEQRLLSTLAQQTMTITVEEIYYGKGCQVFQWQWPPWTRIQCNEKTECVLSKRIEESFCQKEKLLTSYYTFPLTFKTWHLNGMEPVHMSPLRLLKCTLGRKENTKWSKQGTLRDGTESPVSLFPFKIPFRSQTSHVTLTSRQPPAH